MLLKNGPDKSEESCIWYHECGSRGQETKRQTALWFRWISYIRSIFGVWNCFFKFLLRCDAYVDTGSVISEESDSETSGKNALT